MRIEIKRTWGAALVCLAILGLAATPAHGQSRTAQGLLGGGGFGVGGGFSVGGGFNASSYYAVWVGRGVGGGVGGFGGGGFGGGVYGFSGGAFASPALYGGVYGLAGAYGAYGASGYGYNGYGSYQEDSYGGYMRGNADVISNTGRYLINNQQSHLTREQVRQARIDTRRKVFDQYLYERDNTPTVEDERERLQHEAWRRALNDPPVTEIWSARALNDLLLDAQKLQAKGTSGPPVTLDPGVLQRINVAAGRRPGNAAMLKNQGRLNWPAALLSSKMPKEAEELREQIAALLPGAVNQAVNGKVDADRLKELNRAVASLQALLAAQVSRFPPDQYLTARRFLTGLEDGLKVLGQPDAGLYFTDRYVARGRTVPDLIEHMTREGLAFAPALSGDEGAYVALHRALAAYDAAARAQAGPDRSEGKEK
jgi:hypothetical protein